MADPDSPEQPGGLMAALRWPAARGQLSG